jgi:hypothetical protein
VIDTDAGIYPKYVLVRDQESLKSAFHIKEVQYKNLGVYSVLATNYSEGFYFNDALKLWLVFNEYSGFPPILKFFDRSPYELDFEEVGSPTAVFDAERETVYQSPDTSTYLVYPDLAGNQIQDYTVAFWINLDAYGGTVFRSESDNPNALVLTASFADTEFKLFHDAVEYATLPGVATGEWHHVGFTYDSGTEVVRIYLDGEEESLAIDVPGFDSFDGLRVFQIDGKGDDFRIYNKVKSAEFMRTLYQKTSNPAF